MNPAEPGLDPTKVLNQQSLRRSSGTIWLVMGALFLLASLFSFGVVMAGGSGASAFERLTRQIDRKVIAADQLKPGPFRVKEPS